VTGRLRHHLADPAVTGRWAVICGAAAVALLAGVAAAGDSAAVPGLGPATWHPPWDVGAHPGAATVSAVLAAAYLLAAAAVALGLRAVHVGARPRARWVAGAAALAVAVLVLVPPLGSGDHLSYLAYGRIAAAGDDPYVLSPGGWHGGLDPVAGAVQPPWQSTSSVYGPLATAVQAVVAWAGGGSLRLSVWLWQLLVAAAFLLTAWLLDRLSRHDPAARARAAVVWTLNPLLLGELVLGAHIDTLAVAAAVGAIAVTASSPLAAGALAGAAAGIKAPYALVGLALCWGWLRLGPRAALVRTGSAVLGAALVLVPVHLWSGPHTYDQLSVAAKFISFATPWRLLADRLDPVLGASTVRDVVAPASAVVALVLIAVLARALRRLPCAPADPPTAAAAWAFAVLAVGWILASPYALPWYDALAWAPLALLAPSFIDVVLLARLAVLAIAYVPGRVVELTPEVERLTLGFRRTVAPWLVLAAVVALVVWSVRRGHRREASDEGSVPAGEAAPGPGDRELHPLRVVQLQRPAADRDQERDRERGGHGGDRRPGVVDREADPEHDGERDQPGPQHG
jgi:hypothetical protein